MPSENPISKYLLPALVALLVYAFYNFCKPQIQFKTVQEGESQPIKLPPGKHLILFAIENRSWLPIEFKELQIGFSPTQQFRLVGHPENQAFLELGGSNFPMHLDLRAVPLLDPNFDLHSAIEYEAERSEKPFTLYFHAITQIKSSSLGYLLKFIPNPESTTDRAISFLPAGRLKPVNLESRPGVHFFNYGVINRVQSEFRTSDRTEKGKLECYGMTADGKPIIKTIRPQYDPACPGMPIFEEANKP